MSTIPALSEDELETLALFLEEHSEQSEGLDFFGLHGLLTANQVSPKPFDINALCEFAFDTEPSWSDSKQKSQIFGLIEALEKEIKELIESGQPFPVPCDLTVEADEDNESAPLENWSLGFMLHAIEHPESWLGKDEAKVVELIFPIVYASGVNAEEQAFSDIDEDDRLSQQVCEAIPDAVIELFLYFHSD